MVTWSSLWDVRSSLNVISLCTHSRAVANSACIAIASCMLKFIFNKLLQNHNAVFTIITFFGGSLSVRVTFTPRLSVSLGSGTGPGARAVLSASSTGVVYPSLVAQVMLRPQWVIFTKALLSKFRFTIRQPSNRSPSMQTFRGTSQSERRSFTLSVIAKRACYLPLSLIGDPTGIAALTDFYGRGDAVDGIDGGGTSR